MSHAETEIASQPDCWRQVIAFARRPDQPAAVLPRPGERVAVVGCGTSFYMAQAYAGLREQAGAGETDAFPASELPVHRRYDRVVALTRTGTTTEVLTALGELRGRTPTVVITAAPGSPAVEAADAAVVIDFADERSIVHTRYATAQLVLVRTHLGLPTDGLAAQAEEALAAPLPVELVEAEQITFLGRGWAAGVASEAAHKLREAAGAWTEAYPAMEYRHGAIAVTRPHRVVWAFGPPPRGLAEDVARTGGWFYANDRDPLAELVLAQRLMLATAAARGLDPDHPRHLTRSIILA